MKTQSLFTILSLFLSTQALCGVSVAPGENEANFKALSAAVFNGQAPAQTQYDFYKGATTQCSAYVNHSATELEISSETKPQEDNGAYINFYLNQKGSALKVTALAGLIQLETNSDGTGYDKPSGTRDGYLRSHCPSSPGS